MKLNIGKIHMMKDIKFLNIFFTKDDNRELDKKFLGKVRREREY